jgi:hypothetical protein
MQEIGAGRPARCFDQVLDDHQRLGIFALLVKRIGQTDLEPFIVGRQTEGLAILFLGFLGPALAQEGFRQVLAQGNVVGRELDGLAERLQWIVGVGHERVTNKRPRNLKTSVDRSVCSSPVQVSRCYCLSRCRYGSSGKTAFRSCNLAWPCYIHYNASVWKVRWPKAGVGRGGGGEDRNGDHKRPQDRDH